MYTVLDYLPLVVLLTAPGQCSLSRVRWSLHYELHQQLEQALTDDPVNLYQLKETFSPSNPHVVTVSARVNYTLICPTNCVVKNGLTNCIHGYNKTFLWTSLPMEPDCMDPVTFGILSSLHKDYFGTAIPSLNLELAVCNENIPKGVTRGTLDQQLKNFTYMVSPANVVISSKTLSINSNYSSTMKSF